MTYYVYRLFSVSNAKGKLRGPLVTAVSQGPAIVSDTEHTLNKYSFRKWMHERGDKNRPSNEQRVRMGILDSRSVYTHTRPHPLFEPLNVRDTAGPG